MKGYACIKTRFDARGAQTFMMSNVSRHTALACLPCLRLIVGLSCQRMIWSWCNPWCLEKAIDLIVRWMKARRLEVVGLLSEFTIPIEPGAWSYSMSIDASLVWRVAFPEIFRRAVTNMPREWLSGGSKRQRHGRRPRNSYTTRWPQELNVSAAKLEQTLLGTEFLWPNITC